MNKFYMLLVIGVAIFFAYLAGGRVANEQCRARSSNNLVKQQAQILQIKRVVNEKVLGTDTNDIRHVLREKYTIAE